ncbi:MAG: hypothetical protein AAF467_03380 [Actinomycetota bacterium]
MNSVNSAGGSGGVGGTRVATRRVQPGRAGIERLRPGLPRVETLVVIAAELMLVVALHLTSRPDYTIPLQSIGSWLSVTDPTTVLVSVARLAGLIIGYWLLLTTLAYAVAYHAGWSGVTDTLRWVTLPVVRRVVQGVTVMSLTGVSLVGPAAVSLSPALAQQDAVVAQADPSAADPSAPDAADGETDDEQPSTYMPDAAGWPTTEMGGDFWQPSSINGLNTVSADAGTHTVVNGDHLWSIAENHLRATTGRDVTEDEICQYWVRVVDANRSRISSGDPDLIFPAEEIVLPPVFES